MSLYAQSCWYERLELCAAYSLHAIPGYWEWTGKLCELSVGGGGGARLGRQAVHVSGLWL